MGREVLNAPYPIPGCCIYEKPRAFGESSTESEDEDDDDDEAEGCGHVHCVRGHRRGRGRHRGGGTQQGGGAQQTPNSPMEQ
uniref:Protein phosphatase 1 regulatory subunit 11 n=1 Tax=Coturnix japonica TaxID=93934 RepID=A0A8C2SQU4_COTJA